MTATDLSWLGLLHPGLARGFVSPGLMTLALLATLLAWFCAGLIEGGSRLALHVGRYASAQGYGAARRGLRLLATLSRARRWAASALVAGLLTWCCAALWLGPEAGIAGALLRRLWPVLLGMATIMGLSRRYRARLGLYGRLFYSPIARIGFALLLFWGLVALLTALGLVAPHDPLQQISGMKNARPGSALGDGLPSYGWYLLGGDNLARDVFSRVASGAGLVMVYAPLATLFAYVTGIVLGLPAGYVGGRLDDALSFLANLILAFPVIVLFYLVVTPEIVATGLPHYMAAVLFAFPLAFAALAIHARNRNRPLRALRNAVIVLLPMGVVYISAISSPGGALDFALIDLFDIPGGVLVIFVAVVFVNAPAVFRIVRGMTLEARGRDYVAAARTRGEGLWFILLWEILPNLRSPLIVDFCLRIGYTTILLGTLGFFGLGLPPESPDWGSTINEGRKLLLIYPHAALAPAVALLSLVLGLNLLADGLREESLKR